MPTTVSTAALGTVTGLITKQSNSQTVIPGVLITLTGTSTSGDAINLSATSDSSGKFAFRSVEVGTYTISTQSSTNFFGGTTNTDVTVTSGQNTVENLTVAGLAPGAISRQMFLSTTTPADFPAGGPTWDQAPTTTGSIPAASLAISGSQTIDLAGFFTDPDFTNSQVQFQTSDGNMDVTLFDSQSPQTVANFFDYILDGGYNGTIFHRLDTSPPVLQGGGFGLTTDPSTGAVTGFPSVAASNAPTVPNEFSNGLTDTQGTLAMAKMGGDPNSATSQFFFNLADNSTTLGSSNNGGFTVFGAVGSDATSQSVFNELQTTSVFNETATNSAFNVLPLKNYTSTTGFPGDSQESNYLVINNVSVLKRDESLTYSVVSSSNTNVATASTMSGFNEQLEVQAGGQAGTTTITVQATDEFGLSAQASFTVNVVNLAVSQFTNPITAANEASASLSGTTAIGSTVTVSATDGTNTVGPTNATVDGSGNWSLTGLDLTSLSDGTITYTVNATDTSGHSASVTETATKKTSTTLTFQSVTTPINLSNEHATTATGTAEDKDTISVTASDGTTTVGPFTTAADSSGNWSISNIDVSSLSDGTITYTATATDADGNTQSGQLATTKDTVTPPIAITSVTQDISASNDTATSATGTTAAGDTVTVIASDSNNKSTTPVSATVDSSGNWTASNIDVSGLADGTITYTATATDPSGNTASVTQTATKKTSTTLAFNSVTTPINLSNEHATTASGTAEASDTISVTASDGTNTVGPFTTTADLSGNWSISNIDVSSLSDGTITYTATATDSFGNTQSGQLTTTKDTVLPPIAITSVTQNIGASNDTATSAMGTTGAGDTVMVTASDTNGTTTAPVTATVDSSGNWIASNIDVSGLADGTITYTATATDSSGNMNSTTATSTKSTL